MLIRFAFPFPRPVLSGACAALTLLAGWLGTPPLLAGDVRFNRDVRPILSEYCFECHGPDSATREAGLRLDQEDSALSVLEPGDVEASELVRRILAEDPDQRMPPAHTRKQLSDSEKQQLVEWVRSGARYEGHWAFLSLRSELPAASDPWCRNPVDAFILQQLRERDLQPSPEADRATLIRRVTLDLTGLPPTPAEVDRFVADPAPAAYERLIDRLMASPRYGEHMALSWLEAARYADTDGYQNDRYRYQHAWRDWVIEAFNEKLPYDQFVIEQLAGDMLPAATLKQQVATGFGRNHRINSEDGSIPEEWRTEYVVDRVDTLGTVFLGLTVGCARCHDHKYDPISQKEYYELFAYFNNIAEWGVGPNNGNSPPFVELPESWPHLSVDENVLIEPEPVKLRRAREDAGNGLQRPQAGSPKTVMVMHELAEPRETYLLQRGRYDMPDTSQPLRPGVPAAFEGGSDTEPANRLELARWLVSGENPLVPRVAANRMWQQFFGRGIVESSENFGSQGSPPTHPELLDWLASELIRNDWDVQRIQRLILESATYRQASAGHARAIELDPENRWLARGPRVRFSAFELRDQALFASGLLVERIGGESVKPYMPPAIWRSISNNKYQQDEGADLYRRSLYTYWRRRIPPPTMMTFNAASREVCAVRTETTNTPLQALTLMNNKTFVEASRFLAQRILGDAAGCDTKAIAEGFRLVNSREPTDAELRLLQEAFAEFESHFARSPEAAAELLQVGEGETYSRARPEVLAAATMTASLILNLDESITKE